MRVHYLVCATQRSGSTLLCELLAQTGVAGVPNELLLLWLREKQREEPAFWLEALQHVIDRGTTANGVFGCKVMASYLHEALDLLRRVPEASALSDWEIVRRAFADPRIVRIRRRDRLRQAVSRYLSEATGVFHMARDRSVNDPFLEGALAPRSEGHNRDVPFDYGAIRRHALAIDAEERIWDELFAAHAVEPFEVVYEDFVPRAREGTLAILDWLGVRYDPANIELRAHLTKLSNEVNDRFCAEYERIDRTVRASE